eukprot:1126585-Prymnesium_polylepis.2
MLHGGAEEQAAAFRDVARGASRAQPSGAAAPLRCAVASSAQQVERRRRRRGARATAACGVVPTRDHCGVRCARAAARGAARAVREHAPLAGGGARQKSDVIVRELLAAREAADLVELIDHLCTGTRRSPHESTAGLVPHGPTISSPDTRHSQSTRYEPHCRLRTLVAIGRADRERFFWSVCVCDIVFFPRATCARQIQAQGHLCCRGTLRTRACPRCVQEGRPTRAARGLLWRQGGRGV